MNQWIWNLRLDLGQHLFSSPVRLTAFAPAHQEAASVTVSEPAHQEAASGAVSEPVHQETASGAASEPVWYGPPHWARPSFTKGFAGADFSPQPDGTLRCPAGHPLRVQERRPERNGSVRLVSGARLCHCRPCPLREQCQESTTTLKPASASVPWFGPSHPAHPLRLCPLLIPLKLLQSAKVRLHLNPLLTQSCGAIGLAVTCAVDGCICCAHKPSPSPLAPFTHKSTSLSATMTCRPEHNGRIGVSVGMSAWLAMPALRLHLHLRSPSLGSLLLWLSLCTVAW